MIEQDRLYLHRFSPLLVTDNHNLVLMYTKIDLCSVFYKTSTLPMRYIRKDILTSNGNPVSDGASQKFIAAYGSLELNGIVRIVFRVNRDVNVLRAENQTAVT